MSLELETQIFVGFSEGVIGGIVRGPWGGGSIEGLMGVYKEVSSDLNTNAMVTPWKLYIW